MVREMETTKRVGIWVRVSHEDQVRGESPEHHEYRGRMYAESKGWTVAKVYRLDAISGKSVLSLPQAEEMLEDIRAGRVTALIFSKLARLARNTRELLDIAEIFEKERADLISLQESIDTSTPAGRFFYTLLGAMAQWEREEIAERVAASVPVRAKLGKPLGGAAPFGYQWREGKLVPQPEEAPVRRLIYELFLESKRVKTVARLLNERGYRTRNGSGFTHTTVERLLRDPTAKGERRANYSKSLGDGKRWIMKPPEEWITVPVEPVVAAELWDEANRILTERRRTGRKPGPRPVHLFTGLVFCACGGKMAVPSNTPKWVCPKCRTKIPIVDLEKVFAAQLQEFVISPEAIGQHLMEADLALEERRELLATLTREKEKLGLEMDKVYHLYIDDRISAEGFGTLYRPLEDRAHQLDQEIPRLQGEVDFMAIQHLSRDTIFEEARNLYTRWGDLPGEDRRTIVETIVEKITVGKEDVLLDLAYLPAL
jgi:site-specific DNA recombinase